MKQAKSRLSIDLTQNVKKQLEELQKRSEAASLTEVIRRSLSLYDLLLEHADQNGKITLEHEDGTKEILRILG